MVTAAALAALAVASETAAAAPGIPAQLRAAKAPVGELERTDAIPLPGGATLYRYGQKVEGIPVDAALAVVADPSDGPPELVADETVRGLGAPEEPAIGREEAVERAAASVGAGAIRAGSRTALTLLAERGDTLAWRVELRVARPLGEFEVLVDARTGAVLATRNLLRHLQTGRAKLFVPNAITENGGYPPIARIGRREGNPRLDKDRDTRRLRSLRSPVALEHIRSGQKCLKGRWANARLGEKRKKVCRRSLNWSKVTRSENKFEALMAYHAIDRTQTYIRGLGLDDVNDESQRIVADVRFPPSIGQDNSVYFPLADKIELGTGGVDDGEDQDVIIHEYGHAIQDAQVRGFGRGVPAGSMGEGFGDYLAAAISAETPGVPNHPRFDSCVMEWDSTSYASIPSCLRRTDRELTRSEALDRCRDPQTGRPEIHCVGEAWSSAIWALRGQLGDDGDGDSVMDAVVLASHFELSADASFSEAAGALLSADNLLYGNAHCDEIADEMVDREFLANPPACP
jgi:hypothetical protein